MNPFKTDTELLDYLDRSRHQWKTETKTEYFDEPDPGPEDVLQKKIEDWCKTWGRPFLSLRSSKRAKGFLRQTWVDVTIVMPGGRTLYLELKSKEGRMSPEQKALRLQLLSLGHEIYVVKSYKRFLEVVNAENLPKLP